MECNAIDSQTMDTSYNKMNTAINKVKRYMAAIKVSIYRRTGGKHFQAKWIDPASGRTKQKSTKTNIRREAERFAARLEKELNNGTYVE